MREGDHIAVRGLNLFCHMKKENFEALMTASFLQRFPTGVQLIREGDPSDFLYVVVEGSVEMYACANGKECALQIAHPISTFIIAATMNDAVNLMSARTLEQSRLLMIPTNNIRDMFDQDAAFARAIVMECSSHFRSMVKGLKNQKLRTGVERLANDLLCRHKDQGSNGGIKLNIDKRTLASLLGMTPENLSRAFATLGPYGVKVDGPSIHLSNIGDLETLAKPTPLIDDQSV